MPEPCFLGSTHLYAQKHNPFVYSDPIRLCPERGTRSVVALPALQADTAANSLPNFMFIKPNLCNYSHDCPLDVSGAWLTNLLGLLIPALDAASRSCFVAVLFKEGQREQTSRSAADRDPAEPESAKGKPADGAYCYALGSRGINGLVLRMYSSYPGLCFMVRSSIATPETRISR